MKKSRSRRNYYLKNREFILKKRADRYREDVNFRNKTKRTYRLKYHNDPEYYQMTLENARSRYHKDPVYREATKRRARNRNKKIKAKKNR